MQNFCDALTTLGALSSFLRLTLKRKFYHFKVDPRLSNRICSAMRASVQLGLCGLFLFLIAPAAAEPPIKLLYTDWTVIPGRVFYLGASSENTLVQAAGGRLYNVAVGPDGVTYVTDSNTNDLLRWIGGELTVVYQHTTYLRDIAFDPQGRMYFSEATGASADGRIYRLEDGGPSLFFTVSLASVGGFWAGHFSFAPDGTLYLSTGNRRGAHIYQVLG